jgi:starch synthase (maltosyl-transferring)
MLSQNEVPLIYNLFPPLAGEMTHWPQHAWHAHDMGFNLLFINSFHFPGFSGSLYAVKDYYRVNPLFVPAGAEGKGLDVLKDTLHECREAGLLPVMDLIINHTARDCPLTNQHPQWYLHDASGEILSPCAVDPDDDSKVTIWGDLAEIDNQNSPDKTGLWDYWDKLLKFYQRLGFFAFRCDAAYKVPAELWHFLIQKAQQREANVLFFAETLGSTVKQTLALRQAGFSYFFNSSKWWDFKQPWCLQQHAAFGRIAPSLSFPETHDTSRLAADTDGSEAVQRQRYAFAALFSAGLMLPIGYEFGFRTRLDVVKTRPGDWEKPTFDLTKFIRRINQLKMDLPLLQGEGNLKLLQQDSNTVVFSRRSKKAPGKKALIIINKNHNRPAATSPLAIRSDKLKIYHICRDDAAFGRLISHPGEIQLRPAEIILLTS